MMGLDRYTTLARRAIGHFAPAWARGRMLGSDDAIGLVAYALMEADRTYDPAKGATRNGRMFRAGRGAVGDFVRKAGRGRRDLSLDDLDESSLAGPSRDDVLAAYESQSASSHYMNMLLATLPEPQRVAVLLHHAEGLGPAEVGRKTGVSRQAAARNIEAGTLSLRLAAGSA
jgi:DNA-directed RNA polymerase specialized sigma24 family protein